MEAQWQAGRSVLGPTLRTPPGSVTSDHPAAGRASVAWRKCW